MPELKRSVGSNLSDGQGKTETVAALERVAGERNGYKEQERGKKINK